MHCSQKNTRLLPKETLAALNAKYIIPSELSEALQSDDTWVSFKVLKSFCASRARPFDRKGISTPRLRGRSYSAELDKGIRSTGMAEYLAAANKLKDLQSRKLLIAQKEYRSLKKYVLPRSIDHGLEANKQISTLRP